MEGVVVKFDSSKGFGFIRPNEIEEGEKDYFVHINNVKGKKELSPGQNVSFAIKRNEKGLEAVKVKPGSKQASPFVFFATVGLSFVAGIMYAATMIKQFTISWEISYFVAVNIVTFFLYGYDKHVAKAQNGKTRIPEKVLHLFALIGGTPMALYGRRFFRHKTVKTSFIIVFWIVFIVQIVIVWKIWPLLNQ